MIEMSSAGENHQPSHQVPTRQIRGEAACCCVPYALLTPADAQSSSFTPCLCTPAHREGRGLDLPALQLLLLAACPPTSCGRTSSSTITTTAITAPEADLLLAALDADGDGRVSLGELMQVRGVIYRGERGEGRKCKARSHTVTPGAGWWRPALDDCPQMGCFKSPPRPWC